MLYYADIYLLSEVHNNTRDNLAPHQNVRQRHKVEDPSYTELKILA